MSTWRSILMEAMPEEIREQIVDIFSQDKAVTLRPILRGNDRDYFIEVLEYTEPQHCSTCQCERIHAPLPSHPMDPKVKRTRSWHHG